MFENKRLHPAAIILNLYKPIKESIFLIIITFVTFDFGYFLLFLSIYLLLLVGVGIMSWYRFSYRVEEEELIIEYGIFKRTKRTISKNRIQSIDLTESIIHRLFKLARVNIETAGSGTKAEASLAAVKYEEGEFLRTELKQLKTSDENPLETVEEVELPIRKITVKELLLAGVSSGGVGIIIGFVGIVFSEFGDLIPERFYDTTFDFIVASGIFTIIALIASLLILAWLISIGLTFIRYGNFTIKKDGEELFISRGLLEKKQLTIPLNRIQAVGMEENILRQPFGFAVVFAEIAGGSNNNKDDFSTVLFPIMHKSKINAFLDMFVPGTSWENEVTWNKPPKKALKFYLLRSSFILFLAILAVLYFFPSYTWIPIVLFGITLYIGWLGYKDAGFHVEGKQLLLRFRLWKRVTVRIPHKRIQAFEKKQNYFQRKDGLASITASILSNSLGGKHYHVKDLQEEKVDELSEWYSYRKNT